MKIVENKILPPKGFLAINIFGVLFVRKGRLGDINEVTLRHESIHSKQMKELLWVPFYLWYGIEWCIKFCKYKWRAYDYLSFEKEAYRNEKDADYLKNRKVYSFLKYL